MAPACLVACRERCQARLHWGKAGEVLARHAPAALQRAPPVQLTSGPPCCPLGLHTGWDELSQCFDGAKEYPSTWCHFGCAAQVRPPPNSAPLPLGPLACWACCGPVRGLYLDTLRHACMVSAGAGPHRQVCRRRAGRQGCVEVGRHARRQARALCLVLHPAGLLARLLLRLAWQLLLVRGQQLIDPACT